MSTPSTQPEQFYHTVTEAFESVLAEIEAAGHSVSLETYTLAADAMGLPLLQSLENAAKRGVEVRVLLDAFGCMFLPDSALNSLRDAGGEVRYFNPVQYQRPSFRNHRKLLVVDRSVAFVGGFNYSQEYLGDGVETGWRDAGVRLMGSIVEALAESFEFHYRVAAERDRLFTRFRKSRNITIRKAFETSIFTNTPGFGRHNIHLNFLRELRRPGNVDIVTPYFLPPTRTLRLIERKARAGERVRLILPGLSDVAIARDAARVYYTRLLKAGVELYEYQPRVLHAKLYRFSDAIYIGSANLDKRSLFMNYELLVRLESAAMGGEVERFVEDTCSRSHQLTLEGVRASMSFLTRARCNWSHLLLSRVDPLLMSLQLPVRKTRPATGRRPRRIPAYD